MNGLSSGWISIFPDKLDQTIVIMSFLEISEDGGLLCHIDDFRRLKQATGIF